MSAVYHLMQDPNYLRSYLAREIKRQYKQAHFFIAHMPYPRDRGEMIGALEFVAHWRDLQAERRLAIRLGRTLEANERCTHHKRYLANRLKASI